MTETRACIIIWDDAQATELGEALKSRSWRVVVLKPTLRVFAPLFEASTLVVVDADAPSAYKTALAEVNPEATDIIALSKWSTTPQIMKLANQNVTVFVEKPIDVELLAEAIDLACYKNINQTDDRPRVWAMNQSNLDAVERQGKEGIT